MSKMEYMIPENEFSELTVKRGELGGFLVKIAAKDKLLEAGFSSMTNVIQYIHVVLGGASVVTAIPGSLGSQAASDKVNEVPAKEPKKRGRKPGQKSAPKPEAALAS